MPHQLLLKYLSSKTNFVFNQTLYTLFREICRNDTFKRLLKTLLKELFTDKEEILSLNPSNPAKNEKTHGRITSEQEINPVQIPHPSNATFKFPPPRARCTVKCPGYARGGGMLKFRIDRRKSCLVLPVKEEFAQFATIIAFGPFRFYFLDGIKN